MKKTLYTIAALFFILTSMSAFATAPNRSVILKSKAEVLNAYISAATLGNATWDKSLLAYDFLYINTATGKEYGRTAYSDFLKANKGLKFNCTISYEIINETDQRATAKAIMKFENFTRVDYITLHPRKRGWEIAKVVTTYP